MELYHNQVRREQDSFSLRMFHRSWGLDADPAEQFCAEHIAGPTSLETFERELSSHCYDIVGISGIIPNFG